MADTIEKIYCTDGRDNDLAYTANMAYADFYPTVLDTADKCVTYAKLVASDPDGYEGMEFMRWTSDAMANH